MTEINDQPLKRRHIVTFERAAKGDLYITQDAAGYMATASVVDNSILTKLHERRILGWKHIEAAATYSGWQYAFQRPFFKEPRKIYLIEMMGDIPWGDNSPDAHYVKLVRYLTRLDQHLIEKAITEDWNAEAEKLTNQFKRSLDILTDAVERTIEKIACAKDVSGL